MRKVLAVFVLSIISARGRASDIDSLRSYLVSHQVVIARQANGELQKNEQVDTLLAYRYIREYGDLILFAQRQH